MSPTDWKVFSKRRSNPNPRAQKCTCCMTQTTYQKKKQKKKSDKDAVQKHTLKGSCMHQRIWAESCLGVGSWPLWPVGGFFFCQVWAPPGYIQNVVFYAVWGLPLTLNAEGDPSRLNCVPLGHGTAQLQGGGGIQARGLKTWLTEGPEREHFHSAMFRRHHQRNGPNQFPPTARVRPHLSSSLLLFSSFFLSLFFYTHIPSFILWKGF